MGQNMKYTCVKKCFYRNRLYSVGESFTSEKGEKVPPYFVPAKRYKAVEVDLKKQDERAIEAVGHAKPSSEEEELI